MSTTDILRIHAKSLKYRYVDDLQKYKAHKIMNLLGGCPGYQTKQNYCRYERDTLCLPQAVYECQTQNQKEVHHENFSSCKNLDRLPCDQFQKKIPFGLTGGLSTNFALISEGNN